MGGEALAGDRQRRPRSFFPPRLELPQSHANVVEAVLVGVPATPAVEQHARAVLIGFPSRYPESAIEYYSEIADNHSEIASVATRERGT
jgi:hypothetical protein